MVALAIVRRSNARISALPEGLVALFLGGTSGIGKSAMCQFAQYAKRPRIYFVARPATDTAQLLDELRSLIKKDISLIRETRDVVDFVKARESKLDLLFESPGFISFSGRQTTTEGLDSTMTTRYYSRLYAVNGLLPLLNAAPSPRVVSILAGGMEGKMEEDDLALYKPANYGVVASAVHSATMLTLSYEYLAQRNPRISFVHAAPGIVATSLMLRGSTGITHTFMRYIVQPLMTFFGAPVDDVGARALFYSTSDRYSIDAGMVPLTEDLTVSPPSGGGIFLVDATSESASNEKVLAGYRARALDEQVWQHTMEIFNACMDDEFNRH